MEFEDQRKKLGDRLQSQLHWVDLHFSDSSAEAAFGKTFRRYVIETLKTLADTKRKRDLRRIERRVDKADAAAISFVQSLLRDHTMDES